MSERVIVTVRLGRKGDFDLELPLDQTIENTLQDIADTISGIEMSLWFDPERSTLVSSRTNRKLDKRRTLREECVWNGDILTVTLAG